MLQRLLNGKPPCTDQFGITGRDWLAGFRVADDAPRGSLAQA